MRFVCFVFAEDQQPVKLILVVAALRKMAPGADVSKIPVDTLVMNREALLNMYGPTLAALVRLHDSDLDLRQVDQASKAKSSVPKKEKKTTTKTENKIAAPQL